MQNRDDSDRLSWALSALVVLIMGVAVGVSSGESQPPSDSDAAGHAGTPSAERPPQAESRAVSHPDTARSDQPLPAARPARL
jgi:hypothetical protein